MLNSEAQSGEYSVELGCHLQLKSSEGFCIAEEILKTSTAASQGEDREPVSLGKCERLQSRNNVKQDLQSQLPSAQGRDRLPNQTPPTTFSDLSQDVPPKFLCSINMVLSPSQYCLFVNNPGAL